MISEIIWSPRSESDFFKICEYLIEEWGQTVALNFIDKTEDLLYIISRFPLSYPGFDKKKNVRKCVINKYVTLYYRIKKDRIELITFFETTQDTGKLKV